MGVSRRAVAEAFSTASGEHHGGPALGRDGDDPVQSRLRDGDAAIGKHQRVPRRPQPRGKDTALAAGKSDRHELPRHRVADQQAFAVEAHPLGLVEAAELVTDGAIEVADEDAIVSGVRDRDPATAIGRHLAGECESTGTTMAHRRERRPGGEICPAVEELRDHLLECRAVALTRSHGDDVPVRVDDHQGRPGAHAVLLPGFEVRVVEDRVRDAVSRDSPGHRVVVGLVGELRRVHADHDQTIAEPFFERSQLLNNAQAVDAAERPEIEHDHAPAKVFQRQRSLRVDPAAGAMKLRCANASEGGCHGRPSCRAAMPKGHPQGRPYQRS